MRGQEIARPSIPGSLSRPLTGPGLGLRRAFLDALVEEPPAEVAFFEVAPENWIGVGGRFGRQLRALCEGVPLVCHGLSLSIGGPMPLDETFLSRLKSFLDDRRVACYSEHLSYCTDSGHLYELLPIPFTEEAVHYVAARVRWVQEILERRIALENVTYYAAPGQVLSEIDFLNAVLMEADCDVLLDVNNLYVNSLNHRYDPLDFLQRLPGQRIAYLHVAGHYREAEDLLVDTHGAAVIDPVWDLLGEAYRRFGVRPTLLERDFNFPPLATLLAEVRTIAAIQRQWGDSTQVQYTHG